MCQIVSTRNSHKEYPRTHGDITEHTRVRTQKWLNGLQIYKVLRGKVRLQIEHSLPSVCSDRLVRERTWFILIRHVRAPALHIQRIVESSRCHVVCDEQEGDNRDQREHRECDCPRHAPCGIPSENSWYVEHCAGSTYAQTQKKCVKLDIHSLSMYACKVKDKPYQRPVCLYTLRCRNCSLFARNVNKKRELETTNNPHKILCSPFP